MFCIYTCIATVSATDRQEKWQVSASPTLQILNKETLLSIIAMNVQEALKVILGKEIEHCFVDDKISTERLIIKEVYKAGDR